VALPPADDLQRRMAQTREHLHHGAEGLTEDMRKLLDWRYRLSSAWKRQIRRHPWISVTLAAALGYLAVSWRRKPIADDVEALAKREEEQRLAVQQPPAAPRPQWLEKFVTMAGDTLVRAGIAYASQHLAKLLSEKAAEAAPSRNGDEEWVRSPKPR
jgi:hypothetical protein